jgi:transcriptional regulator GlxA family with amidase domain
MNIGIYIYDNAEVLDFSGPFEVLSTAKRLEDNNWNIFLVAEECRIIQARGGFPVQPHFKCSILGFSGCKQISKGAISLYWCFYFSGS